MRLSDGGSEGEPVSLADPEDEQGGAAGRHEDLHQASLPEEDIYGEFILSSVLYTRVE